MNKRGITLVEFIVSLALVAMVMLFLFNLLLDVQYASKNGGFAKDNQMNRASILRSVMDDFNNLGLVGLEDASTSEEELKLVFSFRDSTTKTLTVEQKKIKYGDEVWSMKSSNKNAVYDTNCIPYHFTEQADVCNGEECSDYFSVHIRIPVSISNHTENIMDDLDFFYIGKRSEIDDINFVKKQFLGKKDVCSF